MFLHVISCFYLFSCMIILMHFPDCLMFFVLSTSRSNAQSHVSVSVHSLHQWWFGKDFCNWRHLINLKILKHAVILFVNKTAPEHPVANVNFTSTHWKQKDMHAHLIHVHCLDFYLCGSEINWTVCGLVIRRALRNECDEYSFWWCGYTDWDRKHEFRIAFCRLFRKHFEI